MSSSLTTVIVLVSLIHVAALGVMIWIRVRPSEADGPTSGGESANVTPCVVCGEPATHWGYDGLDANERRDRHTGKSYSTDISHYQPLCAFH